jgi:hypothetical protein
MRGQYRQWSPPFLRVDWPPFEAPEKTETVTSSATIIQLYPSLQLWYDFSDKGRVIDC